MLGFDTTLAGEIGVLAFNIAQGTVAIGSFGLGLAKILYALVTPWNARRIFENARVGRELGRTATQVLSAPLETWLEDSLADVRRRLSACVMTFGEPVRCAGARERALVFG